jgi:hypothetical protein
MIYGWASLQVSASWFTFGFGLALFSILPLSLLMNLLMSFTAELADELAEK